MRERKRDWPQRVYRYRFEPDCLPPEVMQRAESQRWAWNDLVRLGAIAAGQAKAEPALKKIHWWCYQHNARDIAARHGLNWVEGPELLDRIRIATTAAVARIGKGMRAGFPRLHRDTDRVRLVHRFTSGGIPWPRLLNASRGWRFRLGPLVAGHGHQACDFGLDDTTAVSGRLIYGDGVARAHRPRPIPEDAIVKQVALIGRLHQPFGWEWFINATVEEPPPAPVRHERGRAGLDLGWRMMGDYLRVGVLVDEGGNTVELRLPLDATTSRNYGGWLTLADLDRETDENLELAKAALATRLANRPQGAAWHRLRERGLMRLRENASSDPELRMMLDWWHARHVFLWRRRAGLQARLIGNRRDKYRCLAKWLCERYREIGWESDLGLKEMAEEETDSIALRNAQRYRVIVSLHELRGYIAEQAARMGTALKGKAADSSRTCTERMEDGTWCGATVPAGPDRVLTCEAGHEVDQDRNAARQLFSQIAGDCARLDQLRTIGVEEVVQGLAIPEVLRPVAVPSSLE